MIVSEARLAANKLNSQKSTGPRTESGKHISRRNGFKHGMTGEGIVVPEGDAEELNRRVEDLTADMKPRSPAGLILVVQMATLSVRADRAVEQETAALSLRVRHAADDFDEERIERANTLFESLREDPRTSLRKLRKMPEGVERLIDEWHDLKADLTIDPKGWTAEHLERAANLTGLQARHARSSRLGALARGLQGDFAALANADGGQLDEISRRAWAKDRLVEAIDAEIAGLEAHHETLDFETIAIDRAEAGSRALFDPSQPANLARRYEAEARRGFFKALKEFRAVETESEARSATTPTPPATSRPDPTMGSSWQPAPPTGRDPSRALPDAPTAEFPVARDFDGKPLSYASAVKMLQ